MPKHKSLPYRPCVGPWCSTATGSCSSAAAPRGRSMSTSRMCGRCRRAASTRARIPGRRRCASCTRRPTSVGREARRDREWLAYDLPPDVAKEAWKGRYRGQTQKWYALRFTGDESEIDIVTPAGGPQAGIRRMALGADAEPPRAGDPVQAQDLRARGARLHPLRSLRTGSMEKVRWGVLSPAMIALKRVIPAMRDASNAVVIGIASRDAPAPGRRPTRPASKSPTAPTRRCSPTGDRGGLRRAAEPPAYRMVSQGDGRRQARAVREAAIA